MKNFTANPAAQAAISPARKPGILKNVGKPLVKVKRAKAAAAPPATKPNPPATPEKK